MYSSSYYCVTEAVPNFGIKLKTCCLPFMWHCCSSNGIRLIFNVDLKIRVFFFHDHGQFVT